MSDISSILVTGGAGYVGSVVVTKLVELGYKVRVIDSLIYGNEGISKLISNNSIEISSNNGLIITLSVSRVILLIGSHLFCRNNVLSEFTKLRKNCVVGFVDNESSITIFFSIK